MNVLGMIFLLFSLNAEALDHRASALAFYCKTNPSCASQPEYFKQALNVCAIEYAANKCDDLAKSHPETKSLLKSCDAKTFCEQAISAVEDEGPACLTGYKNALVDMGTSIKDTAILLGNFVDTTWVNFKKNLKDRERFLKVCEQSVVCKRDLISHIPRYSKLTNQQLNNYSATFLFTEAESLKGFQAGVEAMAGGAPRETTRRAEQLTSEQQEKLRILQDLIMPTLSKAKLKWSCYNPTAFAELKCYALATVVDPTMVAGYAIKMGRGVVAASRVNDSIKSVRAAELADGALRTAPLTRTTLKKKYLYYSPTSRAENAAWSRAALGAVKGKYKFLDIENAALKALNTSFVDTDVVTSLTNIHKEIVFKKIQALQKEFPDMEVLKYSDFKSNRFAFGGKVPADLEARLGKIFLEANDEFSKLISDKHLVRGYDSPQVWFRGGIGDTADEAGSAARIARRQVADKNKLNSFENSRGQLEGALQKVSNLRGELRQKLKDSWMIDSSGALDATAIEIIKKNSGSPLAARQQLMSHYGLKSLPVETVNRMNDYISSADEFSVGLHVLSRDVATLEKADLGGVSADISGMGARNIQATMQALSKSTGVDDALLASRKAEQSVTAEFQKVREEFKRKLESAIGKNRVDTTCSGDDCTGVARGLINQREKQRVLSSIANSDMAGKFRFSFVSDGIVKKEVRQELTKHGESIEKILREKLKSNTRINAQKLQKLTFGVDMQTVNLNRGRIELMIGKPDVTQLSAEEQNLITAAFRDAVETFNRKESKKDKVVNYRP